MSRRDASVPREGFDVRDESKRPGSPWVARLRAEAEETLREGERALRRTLDLFGVSTVEELRSEWSIMGPKGEQP